MTLDQHQPRRRRKLRLGQLSKFNSKMRRYLPRSEFIGMCYIKEREAAQRREAAERQ